MQRDHGLEEEDLDEELRDARREIRLLQLDALLEAMQHRVIHQKHVDGHQREDAQPLGGPRDDLDLFEVPRRLADKDLRGGGVSAQQVDDKQVQDLQSDIIIRCALHTAHAVLGQLADHHHLSSQLQMTVRACG